jgi:hypothetical protein
MGLDPKARSSAKLNSHTSSESYSMSCPLLCTESETDPNYVQRDTLRLALAIAAPMRAKE